jgi:hypothetical protein
MKGTPLMHTLPIGRLAPALRAEAEGIYATEAAVELLIRHGVWLRREDFLDALVRYEAHCADVPLAQIFWREVPDFLDRARCSGSEARILRLATELNGVDTGVALADLLSSLDDANSQLVIDAITHVLTRGGRR